MIETSHIKKLDKKMEEDGWTFLGAILHYEKAWKEQASIYKKDEKYVVSGIDSSGKNELFESISKKEAENLERSLESIKEKELKINRMQDAIKKKDSLNLALVTNLKGALGKINDAEIQKKV